MTKAALDLDGWDTHFAQGGSIGLMAGLMSDLGQGSVMMLTGGNVIGGKVHAEWPGLEDRQLFDPGGLAVTVDYRDVLGEVPSKRLNNTALEEVFPEFAERERVFEISKNNTFVQVSVEQKSIFSRFLL